MREYKVDAIVSAIIDPEPISNWPDQEKKINKALNKFYKEWRKDEKIINSIGNFE